MGEYLTSLVDDLYPDQGLCKFVKIYYHIEENG
jgi:hypothetical protein